MLGILVLGVNSYIYMYRYVSNIVYCDFSVFLCVSYVFIPLFVSEIAASGVINE